MNKVASIADPEYEALIFWVKEIARKNHDTYGSRRMRKALNGLGYLVGREKTKTLI